MAGIMLNAPTVGEAGGTQYLKIKDSDTPLFTQISAGRCSEVFRVPNDGSGVLISAYCLTKPLKIEMVKIDVQDMPDGGPDCCSCNVVNAMSLSPTGITEAESVSQLHQGNRGVWAMGYGVNMGVLAVPGSYRLCTQESCDLSDLKVCARLVSPEAMANMPAQLIFGNT